VLRNEVVQLVRTVAQIFLLLDDEPTERRLAEARASVVATPIESETIRLAAIFPLNEKIIQLPAFGVADRHLSAGPHVDAAGAHPTHQAKAGS
jgi:hypothetical protein